MATGRQPRRMSAGANLESIKRRLAELGRADVRVIAVSKTHGPERIQELLEVGHRDFGENRQTEARDKFPLVPIAHLPEAARPIYHHIGPLQSGAARQVARIFHWIHGVGSEGALRSLQSAAAKSQSPQGPLRYLIQVRLTAEESKAGGVSEADLPQLIESVNDSPACRWAGFMTMGPADGTATEVAAVFRRLRILRDRFLPEGELSMGMSGDWEIAVQEGATMIRIGSLLFGTRAEGPWRPGSAE